MCRSNCSISILPSSTPRDITFWGHVPPFFITCNMSRKLSFYAIFGKTSTPSNGPLPLPNLKFINLKIFKNISKISKIYKYSLINNSNKNNKQKYTYIQHSILKNIQKHTTHKNTTYIKNISIVQQLKQLKHVLVICEYHKADGMWAVTACFVLTM